jgi:hypothetical protein
VPEYEITGTVDADGGWTRHAQVHETVTAGTIDFRPEILAGSPFSIRLRNAIDGEHVFSAEISWCDDDREVKTLASDVLAHTRFTIDARGSDGQTTFQGRLFTEGY